MIRFKSKRPYFSINGRDLSEDVREIGFAFKSDAPPHERGNLDIAPGSDRNVFEETIFVLTGGRASIAFRESHAPVSEDNPEYRGAFNLSTRPLIHLEEQIGAFSMDLSGSLYKRTDAAGEETEL
ncbi:MAG: hypothetical protein QNK37_26075 [Acidobacteriota bacterium]|nr:hypothetical protein [Acidobacteriota bacterium]